MSVKRNLPGTGELIAGRTAICLLPVFLMTLSACTGLVPTDSGEGDSAVAEYAPDAGYHVLTAEISLVRREYMAATREFLNAANMSEDPALAQRTTEIALEYGLDGYAFQGARRWLVLDPENSALHYTLAVLYLRRSQLSLAFTHLSTALGPVADRDVDDYQAMVEAFGQESDAVGVTTLFARVVAQNLEIDQSLDTERLNLFLTAAALRSGQYDLALESAWSAGVGGEQAIQVELLIARAMVASGDVQTGLDLMAELAERNSLVPVRLEYIRLLAATGREGFATIELERLVRESGERNDIVFSRALINLNAGNYNPARRDFTGLMRRGFSIYECLFYLGQIAVKQHDDEAAIRYFNRVGAGSMQLPAQIQAAQAYSRMGDTDAGLLRLDQFAESHPKLAFSVLEIRGQILLMANRYGEALQEFDAALVYKPRSVSSRIGKATALEFMGRYQDAIILLQDVVANAPANAIALNALGYTLTNRTRRHRAGYRYIRRAYELAPSNPAIMDSMAWSLFKRGEAEKARFMLEQAYKLLVDPEIAAHLGEVLWSLGDPDQASEIWNESLKANPDSRPLNETMDRYLN